MNKYIINYHYFSDGFTYLIIAKNKWQALLKARRMYKFWMDKEFVKIYDIAEINTNMEL